MSFTSQRGVEVNTLRTDFGYTKQQMRFDSLRIETPESYLKGELVFDYDRSDFGDFFNKVQVAGEFVDSRMALDEINIFYNQFGSGKKVDFSTSIKGVLNDCLLYTSPSPRDKRQSRMPSSA